MDVTVLHVGYVGTRFLGWQRQTAAIERTKAPSVQSTLESKLSDILTRDVVLHSLGRTDAGTHVYRQVAFFHGDGGPLVDETGRVRVAFVREMRRLDLFVYDIRVVRDLGVVPRGRVLRLTGTKLYKYYIQQGRTRLGDPVAKYCWYVGKLLDVRAMRESASVMLPGAPVDVSGFGANGDKDNGKCRTVFNVEMRCLRVDAFVEIVDQFHNGDHTSPEFACDVTAFVDGVRGVVATESDGGTEGFQTAFGGGGDGATATESEGGTEGFQNTRLAPYGEESYVLEISVAASGFLKHMVRRLVGTLREIGEHRRPTTDVGGVLGGSVEAGPSAPARGLWLWDVYYRFVQVER